MDWRPILPFSLKTMLSYLSRKKKLTESKSVHFIFSQPPYPKSLSAYKTPEHGNQAITVRKFLYISLRALAFLELSATKPNGDNYYYGSHSLESICSIHGKYLLGIVMHKETLDCFYTSSADHSSKAQSCWK